MGRNGRRETCAMCVYGSGLRVGGRRNKKSANFGDMKVVHINRADTGGGAAVAVQRIHAALRKEGVESSMLVLSKYSDEPNVEQYSDTTFGQMLNFANFVRERLTILPHESHSSMRYNFSLANTGVDVTTHHLVKEADIIHLHWINQGFISFGGLKKLASLGKPIVWTLHDMWPFTGGCHYAGTCLEFNEHCGFCPYLKDASRQDISAVEFKQKRELYSGMNLTVVSCSQWLNSLATCSALFSKKRCLSIANPIDLEVFKPMDRKEARRRLGLPEDKKLLLFGAAKITDLRKGFRYLVEALRIISDSFPSVAKQMELVLFGLMKDDGLYDVSSNYKVHQMGFVSSTEQLVDLYNAADSFVLPSLQDNLPNTVVESMACGTPVVGFRIGGVPEMVDHERTGYLAEVKNSLSLANGIYATLLFNTPEKRREVRSRAEKMFGEKQSAQQYKELYEQLLKK